MAEPNEHGTESRQKLLLAAEVLFANQGYEGTTVRQICEHAGMNIASVNYHFGDKERLYVAAVRNAHSDGSQPMSMPAWPARTPPVEKLRWVIRTLLVQMTTPVRTSAIQLLMRELTNPSIAAQTVVEDFIRPMAHGLCTIVEELVPQLPQKQKLMVALSICGQCLYYRQNREITQMLFGKERLDELDTEVLIEHVTRFSLAALGFAKPYPKQVEKEGAL